MKKFLICLNFLLIFSYSNASTLSFKKIVNLNEPWGSTFLNDHELLITEKSGEIKLVNLKTKNISKINHNLEVLEYGQGGLLDILYKDNIVWVTYTENRGNYKKI